MKFADIPNFSKKYFQSEKSSCLIDESSIVEVLEELPDNIVELVEKYWTCKRTGYIFEVWEDVSWDVAKDILWNGQLIKDEKLAYLIISKALPIYMEAKNGYNEVADRAKIPKAVSDDLYMSQMDFLTIQALAYTLEEAFSMGAVHQYFCTKMMENYYKEQFEPSLENFPRDEFIELLQQEGSISDYIFENFVEKAKDLIKRPVPPKKFHIELEIPGGMEEKDVLKEITARLETMEKDFNFCINPA